MTKELNPKLPTSWGGYDFSKPSLAVVVVNDACEGAVFWPVGGHLLYEILEAGISSLEELGLEPPEPGIWVWEGKYIWEDGPYECPLEGEMAPSGKFRKPTNEEWEAIKDGRSPWKDDDWLLTPKGEESPL